MMMPTEQQSDRSALHVALRCYTAGLGIVAFTFALASLSNRPPGHFTRDPLAVAQVPLYVGFLSNLGALAWAATGSLCWYGAWLAARVGIGRRHMYWRAALATMITTLALDDVFMIHEDLLPNYLNVPEITLFAAYALAFGGMLCAFRREIYTTAWPLLALAGGLFASSIAIDLMLPDKEDWRPVFEDSFKFLGIVGLLGYVAHATTLVLTMTSEPGESVSGAA